jgi:hypothetical protein
MMGCLCCKQGFCVDSSCSPVLLCRRVRLWSWLRLGRWGLGVSRRYTRFHVLCRRRAQTRHGHIRRPRGNDRRGDGRTRLGRPLGSPVLSLGQSFRRRGDGRRFRSSSLEQRHGTGKVLWSNKKGDMGPVIVSVLVVITPRVLHVSTRRAYGLLIYKPETLRLFTSIKKEDNFVCICTGEG